MDAYSLAVVILHYGRTDMTARLHGQLLESDPGACLLVLDNHSPEPWPDPWVRLPENLLWAGALAWTLDRLACEGVRRVWFLNNDLYFTSKPPHVAKALDRLARIEARHGRVGIYSPAADRNPYHPQMVANVSAQYRIASVLDGIAPLIDQEAVQAAGGPDIEGNPHGYGVDAWLSHRIRQAGWLLAVDHQVTVRHVYHTSARRVPGFLAQAAAAENAYLTRRLGPDWRMTLDALKRNWQDHDRI